MFGKARILLVGACVAGLVTLGVAPAVAQSSGDTPKATEIGVTAKEIHIAVIADVDNPFAPGLFKGAADGVKGAAKYINSKAGGGGIAGRKLVVDFIDSHLNANDSRNGVITACQQDYAMVGNVHAVPEQRRRRGAMHRPGGRGHGHPRPGERGDRRAAGVLAGCVPGEPRAAGVQHQGRTPSRPTTATSSSPSTC